MQVQITCFDKIDKIYLHATLFYYLNNLITLPNRKNHEKRFPFFPS